MFYHTKHATQTGFDDSSSEPGCWWFGKKTVRQIHGFHPNPWFSMISKLQKVVNDWRNRFVLLSFFLFDYWRFLNSVKKNNPFRWILYRMTVSDFRFFDFLPPKYDTLWKINEISMIPMKIIDFSLIFHKVTYFASQKIKKSKIRDSHSIKNPLKGINFFLPN